MVIQTFLIGYVAAMIVSELVMFGRKIQTSFISVFIVHLATALIIYLILSLNNHPSLILITIWWAGSFLSWFIVRSHIESSILLYMIYLLRENPGITVAQLLERYHSYYGADRRLEELIKGNYVERTHQGIVVSAKGMLIVKLLSPVIYMWSEDNFEPKSKH